MDPIDELFSENVLAKLLRVASEALVDNDPPAKYPEFVPQKGPSTGRYVLREASFWTCGFFPGLLYLLLERSIKFPATFPYLKHTGADAAHLRQQLSSLCQKWTLPIRSMVTRTDTHDLSFILQPSLRQDWELTSNETSLQALLTGAHSLATRLVPAARAIRSWDALTQADINVTSLQTDCLVIIDSLMNLDLLYYAAAHSSSPELAEMATTHARTLITSHLRDEGNGLYSTYHVVNFDPVTGALKERRTAQGYSESSTWARGQAWAIMGYAQTYHWTSDEEFLRVACGLADYFLQRMETAPECVEVEIVEGRRVGRYVPLWDFDAPINEEEPLRDSSAGVIAANGMLLLSQALVTRQDARAEKYRKAAMRIVSETVEFSLDRNKEKLTATGVVQKDGENRFDGILRNATANYNAKDLNRYSDHGLVYADYYLLEFGNQLLRMGLVV